MPKEIITLEDYKMGRDRLYPDEWTDTIEADAKALLSRVNALLDELSVASCKVSSGWRPQAINSVTKNAAKRSHHQSGHAVDIMDDKDQTLAKSCSKALLEKHGLYREDYDDTRGQYTNWLHLQDVPPASGKRVFRA